MRMNGKMDDAKVDEAVALGAYTERGALETERLARKRAEADLEGYRAACRALVAILPWHLIALAAIAGWVIGFACAAVIIS